MNIANLFGMRMGWCEWNDYLAKIQFLDTFHFQQKVRRENIKNL